MSGPVKHILKRFGSSVSFVIAAICLSAWLSGVGLAALAFLIGSLWIAWRHDNQAGTFLPIAALFLIVILVLILLIALLLVTHPH